MIIKRGTCSKGESKCGWICCQGCEHLTSEGLCNIFPDRPEGCRVYPHNPMALEKGCTFWFEDTETGEKITAENVYSFPEERRRVWLELYIEKSVDE